MKKYAIAKRIRDEYIYLYILFWVLQLHIRVTERALPVKKEKEKVMSKKKKLIAVIVGVVFVVALIVAVVLRTGGKTREQMKEMSTKLQTTSLQKMDLTSSISVTGTIASADSRSITSGLNDVEITSVAVSVGDYVKAGDVICTFDSATIEDELEEAKSEYSLQSKKSNKTINDAKESIIEAESTYTDGVNSGNNSINEAKETYDNAVATRDEAKEAYEKATDAVKSTKKAYEKVKEKKSDLKKNMEDAQKTYQEAKANYEKASEVIDVDLTSEIYDTYKNAEAAYERAKAEYDQVEQSKQNYENAKQQKAEKKDAYDNAETEVSNAYSKYEDAQNEATKQNAKNAETITDRKEEYSITATETSNNLENQKNKVDQVAEKLDDCVVTSPISGVVTSVLVEVGDTYKGEEIAIIQDAENFVVDATVDEYDISDIAKGMKAVIKTDATGDEELEGEVTFVAPTPNSTQGNAGNSSNTSNYSIQITLKDKNERLRVGMTAKTSIVLSSVTDVYAVAYDCVETDESGNSYITVVDYDEELAAAVKEKAEQEDVSSLSENSQGERPKFPEGEMPQWSEGEKPDWANGERPEFPEGEMPELPEGMKPPFESEDATSDSETGKSGKGRFNKESNTTDENNEETTSTKRIYVTVGMESDYYVEISGDGLYEGLSVVTTVNKTTNTSNSFKEDGAMMFGMPGGGQGGSRGGAPMGGPGGF